MSDWLYCFPLVILLRGLDIGLRGSVNVADQIVGSLFSSTELRNKACLKLKPRVLGDRYDQTTF